VESGRVKVWHFKAKPLRDGGGFMGWCARTPDLGEGPMSIDFAEEVVHFEFGKTEDDVIGKLRREVGALS
jgi:hypothetical protein